MSRGKRIRFSSFRFPSFNYSRDVIVRVENSFSEKMIFYPEPVQASARPLSGSKVPLRGFFPLVSFSLWVFRL
jgi:hypothetical protein